MLRKLFAAAGVLAVCAGVCPAQALNNLPHRPNIVVLLLDDQDALTSPFWDAMPQTAALARNGGLNFANAFAPTPICSPGRCTFLSGRLAHNTGVFTLVGPTGGWVFASQQNTEFSVALAQLGYVNAHFGKTWGGDQPNPGWQRWCAIGGDNLYTGYGYQVTDFTFGGHVRGYTSSMYSTDFLAQQAVQFLQSQAGSTQPFFMCLAPTAPHLPLPPAPRHAAYALRHWGRALPTRPNFNERDLSDKSSWLRAQGAARSAAVPYAAMEYHKRMGSLMAVDEMMGAVKNVLVAQGKWQNTVVVFTSDNGYNLGAHRLIHKMAPYEESIRIPLFIAGPGIPQGTINGMVGLHDLAPTFIHLAGGQPAPNIDGKSLAPFLMTGWDSAVPDWRTALVTEYNSGGVDPGYNPGGAERVGYSLDIPTYRSVRTPRYKYIHWVASGEEEVYDLGSDPYELYNLVRANPGGAGPALPWLRGLLNDEMHCAGMACP